MKRLLAALLGAMLVLGGIFACSDDDTTVDQNDAGTPTVTENTNALCSDGKDNDNNGSLDCRDPRCCLGGTPGQGITVCAATTCFGPGNPDPGTTNDGGNTGNTENTNATCGDGLDNDGDGHKDCNDYDCCSRGVPAAGVTVCAEGTCYGPGNEGSTDGGTGTPENTNETCSDGLDNDGNRHKDCDDYSCCRNGVPATGVTVCAEGTCAGPGNEGTDGGTQTDGGSGEQETGDIQCGDNLDNDGDEYTDCKDNSCCRAGIPATGVTICAPGSCEGPGNLNVEYGDTECGDTLDNDEDEYTDCKDNSCCKNGVPAPGVTICQAGSCEGPGNLNVEYGNAECSDGQDNDEDDFTDCADFSCCRNGTPAPGVTVCAEDTCAQL